MDRKDIRRIVQAIEQVLNQEIPGTPRLTGRHQATGGRRVLYVALGGSAKAREALSQRAGQVHTFLARKRKATAAAIMSALRVNRNVVAGAVHELKKAKLIRSEEMFSGSVIESAGEAPSASRARRVKPSTNGGVDRPRRRKQAR